MTSNTARMGPPAMIPVPSWAGCISTRAAPQRPVTAWCSVPFFSFTLNSLRRASSIAFCTATGTSRALPLPMPMPPSPSPTTVSAAKPRTRPPLTTLVTRLTATIFSRRPSPRSSDCCILGCIFAICDSSALPLEFQATRSGSLGQRLHAAVVLVARAIEGNRLETQRFRLLGDALPNELGSLHAAAMLQPALELLLHAGGSREHLVAARRCELRVDVRIGAMDSQSNRSGHLDPDAGLACAPQPCSILVDHEPVPLLLLRFLERNNLAH